MKLVITQAELGWLGRYMTELSKKIPTEPGFVELGKALEWADATGCPIVTDGEA